MNRTQFLALAKVSPQYAVNRALAFRISQTVIDLWLLNARCSMARSIH